MAFRYKKVVRSKSHRKNDKYKTIIMTKLNDLNYILDFLERKNEEGLIATSKSKMNAVNDVVRSFLGETIDDSLYIKFNDGRA